MDIKAVFRELEGMIGNKKLDIDLKYIIMDILDNNGMLIDEVKSRSGVINYHFKSKDNRYVTTFSTNKEVDLQACIYDFDIYEKYFADGRWVVSFNDKGDFKMPSLRTSKHVNTPIHKLAVEAGEGYEVDHIAHTRVCSIREFLRACSRCQNQMNIFRENRVKGNNIDCKIRGVADTMKETLRGHGFTVSDLKDGKCHIRKAGCKDVYRDVAFMEELVFGEFRYDPMKDFTDTWCILILWKMFGVSEHDVMECQREYMVKNHPDKAGYYMLAH